MGVVTVDIERQEQRESNAEVSRNKGECWLRCEGSRGSGAGKRMLVLLMHKSIKTAIITIF